MRNIKIIQKLEKKLGSVSGEQGSTVYCLGDHGCLYICTKGRLLSCSLEDDDGPCAGGGGDAEVELQVLSESPGVLDDVILIHFVSTTGIVYLANRNGSFLQCTNGVVEELFQSDQGIAYFSVSPDSRNVAIATCEGEALLLLTLPDLETLSQVNLLDGHPQEEPGGQTRNNSVFNKESVKIVWREDSRYFAVNYLHNQKFHIKFFDESGSFHSKTEDENELLDNILEWQPTGGLIAGVGTSPHGTVISLFERNGLKRADFYPYDGKRETYEGNKIKNILWNRSSDILSIVYERKVEVWSRNNYVWMRKIVFNKIPAFVGWDLERNYRLHVVDKDGNYSVYDLALCYTTGSSDGSALVASWNGNSIYSTPFRNSCCPPPNCLFQSNCNSDVKAVIVPSFWSGVLSITTKWEATFWRYECADGLNNELRELRSITLSANSQFHSLISDDSYDWLWPNRNTLCCVSSGALVVLDLSAEDFEDNGEEMTVKIRKLTLSSQVVSTFLYSDHAEHSQILAQTKSGPLLKVDLSSGEAAPQSKFPFFPSQVCTLLSTASSDCDSNVVIISHDPLTRKLMAGWSKYPDSDPVMLSNDCTSFTVFQSSSLIFTTIQGFLEIRSGHFVVQLLEKHILGKKLKDGEIENENGKYRRKCEKGSHIVTCCLNQMLEPSLVLQLVPRGNLEIIYPRPLVICTVKIILREKENGTRFEKIMSALRRHRIDYRVLIDEMRLVLDEDPEWRLEELLKTMVDQVKDSHSLVLLVTDLNQEYSDCIFLIKNILECVLKENVGKRMAHVEESYLASLAKLGLLEEALKCSLIQGAGGDSDNNRDLVQHRVKFLSFYCENPDILFDTALGTYDLSLASLVADCLGKDPKEYLPILNEFQEMLELRRRFKIDDRLRRYNKAVISLIRDSRIQHEEIVKYMERHRLFTDVITFLDNKLKKDEGGVVERSGEDTALLLRTAQQSYALYLEERGKLLEASILFRQAQNSDRAIEASMKAGQWEFALEIAYESGQEAGEIQSLCKGIVAQLEDKQMFEEAAHVCESHMADLQQAVYFLLKARKWQHASALSVRSAYLGKSFRDEHIRAKLLQVSHEQRETMEQMVDEIETKVRRLRKVKEMKAAKFGEAGGGGDLLSDNFSDTESYLSGSSLSGSISSSNISGKSYRSGKNKRKLERKVYSMKEGSKYEDLGIIAHLWTLTDKIQSEVKPETSHTIESLWKFEEGGAAISTCAVLEKLLQIADRCVTEVWSLPIPDDILETKYRYPVANWSSALPKLVLHDSSSKASAR